MGKTLQKSNDQLLNAFKKNDEKAMQVVYQQMFFKFRTHALNNSGNEAQAKDVFQEAFVVCWRNIKEGKLKTTSNVEGYLFTIAKNKWVDYLRSPEFKKKIATNEFAHLSIAEPLNEDHDVQEEMQRTILKQALAQLGDKCKNLLLKFYFERKSMLEISDELRITSASARNQKYRCMENLRALSLKLKNHG